MLNRLADDQAYERVTSWALAAGFASVLIMQIWPRLAWAAAGLLVISTIVSMLAYFAARYRDPKLRSQASDGDGKTAELPENLSANTGLPKTEEEPRPPFIGNPEAAELWKRRSATHMIRQSATPVEVTRHNLERWLRGNALPSDAVWRNYLSLVSTLLEATPARGTSHLGPFVFGGLASWDLKSKERTVVITAAEKSIQPVIVKIGPVTIELKDNETRVHVESNKPVVTIGGSEARASEVQIPDQSAGSDTHSGSKRTLH